MMMTSAIGWYGPLIDLSTVISHVGDFVQLLVFVHRSTPVQYKLSKGGEIIRTDIQVGDDTRPFFSVSLWQKQMATLALSGHVILLQNVKIAKLRHFIEARTVEYSSLVRLVQPHQLLVSKCVGVDDLIEEFRLGKSTVEKLGKVMKWVKDDGFVLYTFRSHSSEEERQLPRNWKVPEQHEAHNFFSLSEVLYLKNSCRAMFSANVGEIFLPITWRTLGDSEKEKMFISRRIGKVEDNSIAEDLICIGCQLCGLPLDVENSHKRCIISQNSSGLLCPKSSNHLHVVGLIYRPFMLYVWDESEHLPLLVRNKAAELLFANIRAERAYPRCTGPKLGQNSHVKEPGKRKFPEAAGKRVTRSFSAAADNSLDRKKEKNHLSNRFYSIWLILLKMLLQGKNSSLKFEVAVNSSLDTDNGKFEMVSVSIPCIRM